jgi:hypothetical protein
LVSNNLAKRGRKKEELNNLTGPKTHTVLGSNTPKYYTTTSSTLYTSQDGAERSHKTKNAHKNEQIFSYPSKIKPFKCRTTFKQQARERV